MQTINTKHYGPISFDKTWVSSDGRHIGKLTKGGYAHLSGSVVSLKRDLEDLITNSKDREEAFHWFTNKDNPKKQTTGRKILLKPDGSYAWADGSPIIDAADLYSTLCEGPQLEAVLMWFRNRSKHKDEADVVVDQYAGMTPGQIKMAKIRAMKGMKKAA